MFKLVSDDTCRVSFVASPLCLAAFSFVPIQPFCRFIMKTLRAFLVLLGLAASPALAN
jgi:hypothetical protein